MKATNEKRGGIAWGEGALALLFLGILFFPWNVKAGIDLTHLLELPSLAHPLGTDYMGRDLLLRIRDCLYEEVLPLWVVTLSATLAGLLLGGLDLLATGLPWLKRLIFYPLNLLTLAFASIPIGIAVFAWSLWFEQAGFASLALGLFALFLFRAHHAIRNLYERDKKLAYWDAHVVMGGSVTQRIWHYGLLGNWRGEIAELFFFNLQIALVVEASLSYLGFGIQEPQASLGNILAAHLNRYLRGDVYVPVLIIVVLFCLNRLPRGVYVLLRGRARLSEPGNFFSTIKSRIKLSLS